ncbi:hypothetical protein B7494_g271 [Chlorociboria aeruginascens]|nr:hypothetical protein B7494_g271 [Chlorociboria aeruginascens]
MLGLIAVHLGANYLAVRAVSMRTLNRQRANILFSNFLDQMPKGIDLQKTELPSRIKVFAPEEVSIRESVFERDGVLRWNGGKVLGYCKLGVELRSILDLLQRRDPQTGSYQDPSSEINGLLEVFTEEEYIMWYDLPRTTFLVVLKEDSSTKTQLKAWMHALVFASRAPIGGEESIIIRAGLKTSLQYVNVCAEKTGLWGLLEDKGWDITTGAIETKSGSRIKIKGRGRARDELTAAF